MAQLSLLAQGGGTGAGREVEWDTLEGGQTVTRSGMGTIQAWTQADLDACLPWGLPFSPFACLPLLCLSLLHHTELLFHFPPTLACDVLESLSAQM